MLRQSAASERQRREEAEVGGEGQKKLHRELRKTSNKDATRGSWPYY